MDKNNNIFLLLLGFLLFIIKIYAKEEEPVDADKCRFLNCPTKPLHFEEKQPFGTGVIKLEAVCKNKTREIVYRLNSHDGAFWMEHFSIDNKTGWINLTHYIDREFLGKGDFIDVIVTAEGIEKGLRVLKTCSFEIYIDDVNDFPPMVNSQENPINLDPLSDPFIVDTVDAYDMDAGDNARFKYSMIRVKGANNDTWPFTIDEDSGTILVIGDLRHTKEKEYTFEVTVSDKGSPPRSSNTYRSFNIMPVPEGALTEK